MPTQITYALGAEYHQWLTSTSLQRLRWAVPTLQGIIIEGQTALFRALQRTPPQFAETLRR